MRSVTEAHRYESCSKLFRPRRVLDRIDSLGLDIDSLGWTVIPENLIPEADQIVNEGLEAAFHKCNTGF